MTNTDTADVDATVAQVAALARAGSEIVRITVDRDEAAAAVPRIGSASTASASSSPSWGFPLYRPPAPRRSPRHAPRPWRSTDQSGQCRLQGEKDRHFGAVVEQAIRHGAAVRIGANWGSLDQEL